MTKDGMWRQKLPIELRQAVKIAAAKADVTLMAWVVQAIEAGLEVRPLGDDAPSTDKAGQGRVTGEGESA